MQKNKKMKILLSVFLLAVLIFSSCHTLFAANEVTNDGVMPISEDNNTECIADENTTIDTSNWVNEDLFLSKENIAINKVVDGNSFLMGNTVRLTTEMSGDVFVFANELIVENTAVIYSNLFFFGNKVTIKGLVNNLYASCANVALEENDYGISILRDLRVIAGQVTIHSAIRRNAYITANTITFAEPTTDITSQEDNILVGQDFYYTTPNEISIPEGVVYGQTHYTPSNHTEKSFVSIVLDYTLDALRIIICVTLVAFILSWLAPNFTKKVSALTTKQSFLSLGIGFAAFCVSIIAFVILLLTIVGSTLAVALFSFFLLLLFLGDFIASYAVAGMINNKMKKPSKILHVLFTVLISVAIFFISKIPFVGGFILFLVILYGLGIVLHHIFTVNKKVSEN